MTTSTKTASQEKSKPNKQSATTNALPVTEQESFKIPDAKIAIMSFSGNVGKTTIKDFLLVPRMDLEAQYSIESLNTSGNEDEHEVIIRGNKFEELQKLLVSLDSVVVDVGVSNAEDTIKYMKRIEGSHEEFDWYVIPVTSSAKQLKDTINTIYELLRIGVEPDKFKIVFNMVEDIDDVETEFQDLIYMLDELNVPYNTKVAIKKSEFYPNLTNLDIKLDELLSSTVEENKKELKKLKAKRKGGEELNKEETARYSYLVELITLQRFAKSAIRNLNDVSKIMFADS